MLLTFLAQYRQRTPDIASAIPFLIFGLIVGIAIGAVLVRASCALYNKFVGDDPDKIVPSPSFGQAMGIAAITLVANFFMGIVVGLMLGLQAKTMGWSERTEQVVTQLVSTPVSLAVFAAMLSWLLPTTFSRGMLVALCQLLIVLGIVAFIVILMMVTSGLWK